jgi:predicted dehydrogenase
MIRLALVGCGAHSESGHAIPLARYKAAHPAAIELAAVCDLQQERAQSFVRKYGFSRCYVDVDEMLAREKLDGCIVVVPVETISELGIKLLRQGIPCVVEKPMGASLSEAQALLDAARTTLTPNMVSVNRRFMPFLNRALAWCRDEGSRSNGRLRLVRCTMARHARGEPDFLWTTAVHAVDTLRHIAGEVADVKIRTLGSAAGSANWYGIDLRFEAGVTGYIEVLPTSGMVEETYELFGDGFRATVTCPFGPQRGWRGFRENQLVVEEVASEGMAEELINGCYEETAEFVTVLSSNNAPGPSIEDVFPSVELCFAMAKTVNGKENIVPTKI